MDEFYKILGVSENSTDEEIKKAYEDLEKVYCPNDYEGNFKKQAEEKTKQIKEAFDAIMNERRARRMQNRDRSRAREDGQYKKAYEKDLEVIQELIEQGNIEKADELLMFFKNEERTAGWYYLKGIVLYKKGWILESSNFFETAARMDPSNEDYKKAVEKVNWQKRGNFGGPKGGGFGETYPTPVPFGCSFCDICGGILCMDFCCDCGMPRGYGRCC